MQLVANTPSTEVLENELVKEFADRCLSASRSIQGYMTAENPGPDNETMESLIDVNEELQQALNSQKRAVLSARKELGIDARSQNTSPQPPPEPNGSSRPPVQGPSGSFGGAPPVPRSRDEGKGKGRQELSRSEYVAPPPGPPPGRSPRDLVSPISLDEDEEVNPFRDPEPVGGSSAASGKATAAVTGGAPASEQPNLDYEPFHPGFSQPTQSYLGRQDSAMDKIQMHGAGSGSPQHGELDKSTANGSSKSSRQQQRYDYEDEEEEDIYNGPSNTGGSSSGKRPVYRY